jgi:uracil-DNA glycosylase family 4
MDMEERFQELLQDTIDYVKTGFRSHSSHKAEKGEQEEAYAPEEESRGYNSGIDERIRSCRACRLYEKRRNAVPGTGNTDADIVFIGEGPGEQEDIQGLPFVGKAGQLLTKMLAAIELGREEVYITNVVKCRPPGNRAPLPDEVEACFPYLEQQIRMIEPRIIVCLGGPAVKTILKSNTGITILRGQVHRFNEVPVIATYHPAAVLRFPERYKRDVWNDLKLLRELYRDMRPPSS